MPTEELQYISVAITPLFLHYYLQAELHCIPKPQTTIQLPSGAQVSESGRKEHSGVTCVNISITQASSEYANVGFASQEEEATYENFGNNVIIYVDIILSEHTCFL